MPTPHKNKTLATFLATTLGGLGVHRFYLRGALDRLGILHLTCLPIAGLIYGVAPQINGYYHLLPLLLSYVVGFLEALVIGLMPDEKFDAAFNPGSHRTSDSSWILALILVATMLVGTTALIFTMVRLFDLLYTGGSYG